jgi:hypothetical protein
MASASGNVSAVRMKAIAPMAKSRRGDTGFPPGTRGLGIRTSFELPLVSARERGAHGQFVLPGPRRSAQQQEPPSVCGPEARDERKGPFEPYTMT